MLNCEVLLLLIHVFISVDGAYYDYIIIKYTVFINIVGFLFIVFIVLANAECTFDIELLVDGNPWSSNGVLYKPVGSSGSFVRCQRCNDRYTDNPNWVGIPLCNGTMQMVCKSIAENGFRDLQFSSFMKSGAQSYNCRGNGGVQSIRIAVLTPPIMRTHPTSQVVTISTSVTLDCEGTGKGPITYHWETSNINEGQWMNISDSNSKTLVVRNLEQSQHYRCVVSNEVGSSRSDVATITVLSKCSIYILCKNTFAVKKV